MRFSEYKNFVRPSDVGSAGVGKYYIDEKWDDAVPFRVRRRLDLGSV